MEYLNQFATIAIALIFVGSFVQTAISFWLGCCRRTIAVLVSPDYVPAPICLIGLFISNI